MKRTPRQIREQIRSWRWVQLLNGLTLLLLLAFQCPLFPCPYAEPANSAQFGRFVPGRGQTFRILRILGTGSLRIKGF